MRNGLPPKMPEVKKVKQGREERYLTFSLAGKRFGIEILKVQGIISVRGNEPFLRDSGFIQGAIQIEGHTIPIVDLAFKLGMNAPQQTQRRCVVFVRQKTIRLALAIDNLPEVYHIPLTDIVDKKEVQVRFNSNFLTGIGKCADDVIFLLDFEKMFSNQDIEEINRAMFEANESRQMSSAPLGIIG